MSFIKSSSDVAPLYISKGKFLDGIEHPKLKHLGALVYLESWWLLITTHCGYGVWLNI